MAAKKKTRRAKAPEEPQPAQPLIADERSDEALMPPTYSTPVEVSRTDGPNKGKSVLVIYELSCDSLKVCYALTGTKRPTEFKA